jgi:hypothetical protein
MDRADPPHPTASVKAPQLIVDAGVHHKVKRRQLYAAHVEPGRIEKHLAARRVTEHWRTTTHPHQLSL